VQSESGDAAPRKRARSKPGGESSSAAADEDAATAAWSRATHKSREVLVREYIMLLLLERRNLRFKEYLCAAPPRRAGASMRQPFPTLPPYRTQCTLEEKIADVAFDASDGEDGRRAKLRVLHEYNDVLGLGVHAEPGFEAQSVRHSPNRWLDLY